MALGGNNPLAQAKRVVVKIGSALVAKDGKARQDWLKRLAEDIADRRAAGQEIVLVSSGAIALGRDALGPERPRKLEEKQAAAALGQPMLMAALAQAFAPHGISVAQSLLTLDDTETRRRWLNARATLETLMAAGAVEDWEVGADMARESLDSGRANDLLGRWIDLAK